MIQSLKKTLPLRNTTRIITSLYFFHSAFSSTPASQDPEPKPNPIADYLIKSCGFSPQKAARVSNYAVRRFPQNANSVRHFFKYTGYTDAQFHSIVSNHYNILWADVDKTLKPNMEAVYEALQFYGSDLCRFVLSNPQVFTFHGCVPRLEFWKEFLKNDMRKLLLVFTKNPGLVSQDIDSAIVPKFALLKAYGLSEEDIATLLVRGSGFIRKSTAAMEIALKKVQELGFPRGSSMFVRGLVSLGRMSASTFQKKMEFFMSCGWSETEVLSALRRAPSIMELSCENVKKTMEFLEGVAGCTQSYIARHPRLLSFSVEKRLMPRYDVLKTLKSNKSVGREWDLCSVMTLTERMFVTRMIYPYRKLEPTLHNSYAAAYLFGSPTKFGSNVESPGSQNQQQLA